MTSILQGEKDKTVPIRICRLGGAIQKASVETKLFAPETSHWWRK
jgi:hypothetical protein